MFFQLLYGAREIDRVIRNEIKPLFVDEILFGRLRRGGELRLDAADGHFMVSAAPAKKAGSVPRNKEKAVPRDQKDAAPENKGKGRKTENGGI